MHEEEQYLNILRDILENGDERLDRTKIGTKAIFGTQMRFDLSKGFPLLTTRFISFRIAFEEMMFFLRGDTDTKKLEAKNINIWKGNTSRDFLDKKGLSQLPEGDMGKGYGWQIRNFGGTDRTNGFDQLEYLVKNIKENPNDRRHYMNYWNPIQVLNEAALPPCHLSYTCQIINGKLNASFKMRSWDFYHGAGYNISGYAFLTHLIAKITGYKVGYLVSHSDDTHLYNTQLDVAKEQLLKVPFKFPTFTFKKEFSTLKEALNLSFDDVEIIDYKHHGKLKKIPMAI